MVIFSTFHLLCIALFKNKNNTNMYNTYVIIYHTLQLLFEFLFSALVYLLYCHLLLVYKQLASPHLLKHM